MVHRTSYAQLEALVDFLEVNPDIAKGVTRSSQGKVDTKNKWASIATHLNSLGTACKDGRGWAKYWAEKKCSLKKLCSDHAQRQESGGGDEDSLPALSALELRMVAVMGSPDFVTGSAGSIVEPLNSFVDNSVGAMEIQLDEPKPNKDHHPAHGEPSTSSGMTTSTCPCASRAQSVSDVGHAEADMMPSLAHIEARRVETETVTAEALRDAAGHFGKCADALVTLSSAITEGANAIAAALLEIAKNMPSS